MTALTPTVTRAERRPAERAPALAGAGFVVCALLGNSLTESTTVAQAADSTSAVTGLAVELLGFVLLLVFVGWLATTARAGLAGSTAAIAGGVLVAVKLGSGGALLAAWHEHEQLDGSAVDALLAVNDAAFVLAWLPFGVLIVSAAIALSDAGIAGPVLRVIGLVVGSLTVALGIAGAAVPAAAVPIPFLLCLVWLVAVGVRGVRAR